MWTPTTAFLKYDVKITTALVSLREMATFKIIKTYLKYKLYYLTIMAKYLPGCGN